jgi:hypothetical protein
VTPEFSLALPSFQRSLPLLNLWPKNENLIFENDFNAQGNRDALKRAKPLAAIERARRVTFITLAMATLMVEAR